MIYRPTEDLDISNPPRGKKEEPIIIGNGITVKERKYRKFYTINMDTKEEKEVQPEEIKKGDVFRMDESDGTHIIFNGCNWYIAYKDAIAVAPEEGRAEIYCFEIQDLKVLKEI